MGNNLSLVPNCLQLLWLSDNASSVLLTAQTRVSWLCWLMFTDDLATSSSRQSNSIMPSIWFIRDSFQWMLHSHISKEGFQFWITWSLEWLMAQRFLSATWYRHFLQNDYTRCWGCWTEKGNWNPRHFKAFQNLANHPSFHSTYLDLLYNISTIIFI